VKEVLRSLSRAGREGGPVKMVSVCGRVGLGNITRDNFV
jgi:hypothetical protein